MRKLALLGVLVLGAVAVLSTPPAHAQAKCGNDICMGSRTTKVRILGNVEVISPDGGFSVSTTGQPKMGTRPLASARAFDGGTASSACQFGHKALVNGDGGVVFASAFTSLPVCNCTHVATTNANACVLTTAPTTTAAGFSVQSADTDVIDVICCGDL